MVAAVACGSLASVLFRGYTWQDSVLRTSLLWRARPSADGLRASSLRRTYDLRSLRSLVVGLNLPS